MNSKITIEFDEHNNNRPVIRIIARNSDDTRDKLLKQFVDRLVSPSSWCTIKFVAGMNETSVNYDAQQYIITPLKADDLKAEADIMIDFHKKIYGDDNNFYLKEIRNEEGFVTDLKIEFNGKIIHEWALPKDSYKVKRFESY